MAFGGYLGKDYYTVLDQIMIDKIGKNLRFQVRIYSDSSKKIMLAYKDLGYCFNHKVESMKGTVISPDHFPRGYTPKEEDTWWIGPKATGAWEPLKYSLAKFRKGEWQFWGISPGQPAFDEVDKEYKVWDDVNKTWILSDGYLGDARQWDEYLGSNMLYPNSDIYRQIYRLVKRYLVEFADCTEV